LLFAIALPKTVLGGDRAYFYLISSDCFFLTDIVTSAADTSELAALNAPLNQSQSGSEPMAAWMDSDDIEEDMAAAWEDFLNPSLPLLVGWEPSPMAARMWGWMVRRHESMGQSTFTLNDLATGRPLGKKASHSAEVLQPLIGDLLRGGVISTVGDRSISLNL
jgi:hypothetical protein